MFVIRSIREPRLHETVETAREVGYFFWGRSSKDWTVFKEIEIDISDCASVGNIIDRLEDYDIEKI